MKRLPFFALCLALLPAPALLAADSTPDAWRKILEKNSDSVVRVSATLKSEASFRGQAARKNEKRLEVTGTVLDASGLTVVSLAVLDPGSILKEVLESAPGNDKMAFKSDLSDLKIWMPGGIEAPARLVYKDAENDLAFVMPDEKASGEKPKFTPLESKASGDLQLMDEVLTIDRMDKPRQRAVSATLSQISTVLVKPYPAYICAVEGHMLGKSSSESPLGAPVFGADGKFAGLRVMYKGGMGAALSRQDVPQPIPIMLPAKQVLESAKQAQASLKPSETEKTPSKDKEK